MILRKFWNHLTRAQKRARAVLPIIFCSVFVGFYVGLRTARITPPRAAEKLKPPSCDLRSQKFGLVSVAKIM